MNITVGLNIIAHSHPRANRDRQNDRERKTDRQTYVERDIESKMSAAVGLNIIYTHTHAQTGKR